MKFKKLLLLLLCRIFTGYELIAQRFIALRSIPAVPNSAVIWVLVMLSPMPKTSVLLLLGHLTYTATFSYLH